MHWSDEDREYVGLCSELPSLSWLAKTPGAALNGIRRLVAETLTEMAGSGETPPRRLSSRRYSGKFLVRLPPDTHRRLASAKLSR